MKIGIEVWCKEGVKRTMKYDLFAEYLTARYNQCLREFGLELLLEHQRCVPDTIKKFIDPFEKLLIQSDGFNSSM